MKANYSITFICVTTLILSLFILLVTFTTQESFSQSRQRQERMILSSYQNMKVLKQKKISKDPFISTVYQLEQGNRIYYALALNPSDNVNGLIAVYTDDGHILSAKTLNDSYGSILSSDLTEISFLNNTIRSGQSALIYGSTFIKQGHAS